MVYFEKKKMCFTPKEYLFSKTFLTARFEIRKLKLKIIVNEVELIGEIFVKINGVLLVGSVVSIFFGKAFIAKTVNIR